MFEKASRKKLRFQTSKGLLTIEDLWDIPLKSQNGFSLDSIAKRLNRELRDEVEESFVDGKSSVRDLLELQFEIVKHIIAVRLQEAKDAQDKVLKQQKAAKIKDILARKEEDALANMTPEELTKMLNDLAA